MSEQQPNSNDGPTGTHFTSGGSSLINNAERRERPTTDSTPDPKRTKNVMIDDQNSCVRSAPKSHIQRDSIKKTKAHNASPTAVVVYPTNVPVPSKKTVEGLYKAAIEEDTVSREKEQIYLKPAGVLSLKEVMLPALALEEETAVKRVQAKVQRDAAEYTYAMKHCRRLIRQSVADAMTTVGDTSRKRDGVQAERRKQEVLRRRASLERKKQVKQEEQAKQTEEQQNRKQEQLLERKALMTRQHPQNQDFWKEVVFLTSSMAQLEKEERMWAQMERNLHQLEEKETPLKEGETEDENSSELKPSQLTAPKHDLVAKTERQMEDILRASNRIQRGLGDVLKLLEDTEEVRKIFFKKYYLEHYFDGYVSLDNPKNMIRFLSQSQDDYV
mmetsp:Transcript_26881/g.64122  ORF Transcript_26881/g.64122 Transcript_26881/m.64122 type:complete len:386 (+) Transcript_26881:81-1238(+)